MLTLRTRPCLARPRQRAGGFVPGKDDIGADLIGAVAAFVVEPVVPAPVAGVEGVVLHRGADEAGRRRERRSPRAR